MKSAKPEVLVVGGGGWGAALAAVLAAAGRRTRLWVRRAELADEIQARHTNERYLPGVSLPSRLAATTDLEGSVRDAPVVLLAVPSQSFREVARRVGDAIGGDQVLVHATKGIEVATGRRMSQVLREETCSLKLGVLTGPTLAREVVAGRPAGAVIASRYDEVVARVQGLFAGTPLRVYAGRDVVGAEVGGSFKNVVAIAAGVADGLGLGDNTRSLVVTRGLAEMARYGASLGADPLTFTGLAGVGDLVTTCSSPLSRNRRLGVRIAQGARVDEVLGETTEVAEGVPTSQAVQRHAATTGLDLPIARAVYGMLHEGWSPAEAQERLLASPVGVEAAAFACP